MCGSLAIATFFFLPHLPSRFVLYRLLYEFSSLTRCPPDFLALENMLAQGPDEDRESGEPVAHMRQEPTTSTSHSRFSRYLRFARRRRHEANDQGAPPPPPPSMVVPL